MPYNEEEKNKFNEKINKAIGKIGTLKKEEKDGN
jgi:hypothetical protein